MKVQVYQIDKSLPLPKHETSGSFGFDFLSRTKQEIKPQEVAFIPGNVIIKCPENLALLVLPRSSMFRKKFLIFPHSIGLIDRDYCGPDDEILIQVFNLGNESVVVERGERIAQGIFVKTLPVTWEESEDFLENRSRGGFGSTK